MEAITMICTGAVLNDLANNCTHTNSNIRRPKDPRVKHMINQCILKNTKYPTSQPR